LKQLIGNLSSIENIELRDGTQLTADDYILAVPHYRVSDLLPETIASQPAFQQLDQIETAPISSLHLWFDRPVLDVPHAVLLGRLSQWVFRSPESKKPQADKDGEKCQVVISASRMLRDLSQEEVRDHVINELADIWPQARTATLTHWRMVTEHRAVFSATPGIEQLRPTQQSSVTNLQLAGDWTDTGWPATMESAIRSGYLAAENILRRRQLIPQNVKHPILQPDLPTSRLARLSLGLS